MRLAAADAAQGRAVQAQQAVHLPGGVFIDAVLVMHQDIVGLPDMSGGLAAEAAHRRGQVEGPDGRAHGHMVIAGQVLKQHLRKGQYLKIREHGVHAHPLAAGVQQHGQGSAYRPYAHENRPEQQQAACVPEPGRLLHIVPLLSPGRRGPCAPALRRNGTP